MHHWEFCVRSATAFLIALCLLWTVGCQISEDKLLEYSPDLEKWLETNIPAGKEKIRG